MELTFWGVRGSIPSPGPGTVGYGGNTPCLSVRLRDGALVIFDCGTGARNLGNALMGGPFGKGQGQATVVLSHAQWDHIQGFPFFRPFYVPGNRFDVVGGGSPDDLQRALEGQMAAQYFPVQTYRNMAAAITLVGPVPRSGLALGAGRLTAAAIADGPPGAAAYRLQEDSVGLAYVGHGSPADRAGTVSLCRGVDVLVHECSFTPEDQRRYPERALSSFEEAVSTALEAGARKLILTHYDQDYTDKEIDLLLARARAWAAARSGHGLHIEGAAEGLTLTP